MVIGEQAQHVSLDLVGVVMSIEDGVVTVRDFYAGADYVAAQDQWVMVGVVDPSFDWRDTDDYYFDL